MRPPPSAGTLRNVPADRPLHPEETRRLSERLVRSIRTADLLVTYAVALSGRPRMN